MKKGFSFLDSFGNNFVAIFMIIGLFVIFRKNARIGYEKRKNILWTAGCIAILVVVDSFEIFCSMNPDLSFWRLLASVIGYWLRPVVSLGFFSLIADLADKRYFYVWIPVAINFIVFSTAFFTKWTFWFDENYDFQRGPLGYTVFVVSFFYIIIIVFETIRNFKSGQRWRGATVLVCAAGCIAAPLLEATDKASYIMYPTILISILLYTLYLYSDYLARDALTGLWKRDIFYQDVNRIGEKITGVIIADMNGLKTLNDTKGHKDGDEALVIIAKTIRSIENNSIWAYRMGGDEFAILCLDQTEENIAKIAEELKKKANGPGFSLSVGYSMKTENSDIDSLMGEADKEMYQDKNRYYQENNLDRRKS